MVYLLLLPLIILFGFVLYKDHCRTEEMLEEIDRFGADDSLSIGEKIDLFNKMKR